MINFINKKNLIGVFLMICLSFQTFGQNVTMNVKNASISSVLTKIQKDYGYSFAVKSNDLDLAKVVSVSAKNQNLVDLVQDIFKSTGQKVDVSVGGQTISISSQKVALPTKDESPKNIVTGRVLEKGTNTPVLGAAVYQQGTANGTMTDLNGNYSISIPEGAVLIVSCIGFENQSVVIGKGTKYDFALKEDTTVLDEVVITGYGGSQLRSKMTNSIAKVDQQAFAVGSHTNPASALSGAVSGLRVIQSSGNPNAVPSIILRGGTNFDGTGSPLVIIDGQLRDSMADINSEDIESMEVLKDAGATAIYGARASNGVILITTKQGKEGFREINFKAKVGLNYFYLPWEFCDAGDYIYWMRKAYNETPWANKSTLNGVSAYGIGATTLDSSSIWNILKKTPENSYLLQKGWQEMKDPLDPNVDIIYKDTRATDYNINSPAVNQDYNVNMSGGNDKGTYYAGLGYNASDGTAQTTYYKRLSFIFNASYKVTNWLTSKSNVNFARTNGRSLTGANSNEQYYFGRSTSNPPTARYVDEDGNLLLGNNNLDGNQQFQKDFFFRDNENLKTSLGQGFTARINDDMTFNINADWYINQSYNEAFDKDYPTNQAGTGINKTRSSSATFSKYFTQTYNATLRYNKEIAADHNLDVMVGAEYYDRGYVLMSASGSGAPTDDFRDLGLTSTDAGKRAINSDHTQYRIMSYFGRLNYDYAGKYLLSATFRADGYSALIDNRWGYFPGISAGWVFSKEDFVRNAIPALSFGKLRVSYGINGNASGIGPYDLQGAYSSIMYNGMNAFMLSSLPNPSLRWERSNTFEVGTDVSFFHNRLNANLTYYNRLTDDKYANLSLPSTTGYSSIKNNNGKFSNKGVEIELSGKIIQNRDFYWDVSANIAYNKNKIIALPDNGLLNNRQNGTEVYTGKGDETMWVGGYQEGQEPGLLIGYVAEGIFRNPSDFPTNYVVKSGNNSGKWQYTPEEYAKLTPAQQSNAVCLAVGDVKWKDINGDGVIDSHDQVVIGNSTPHWIGGFNTRFKWKGLSLYAQFDYALGFYTRDTNMCDFTWYMGCMQGAYNMCTEVWETVSESNPNGKYPRYVWADQNGTANYKRPSTMFTYKGDYLAIREVALSYSLPKKWMERIKAQNIEFSITGQNLGYLTAAKVANPESGGATLVANPLPRTVIFGVNVTF